MDLHVDRATEVPPFFVECFLFSGCAGGKKTQEFLCDTLYNFLLYASHFVASQGSKPSQLGLLLRN